MTGAPVADGAGAASVPGRQGTGGDTAAGATTQRRPPRRLRALLIGVVIATGLALFLFVGLGTSPSTGPGSGAVVGSGSTAPNFRLPSLSGGPPVVLDALGMGRHRPVVLNFFASWCIPCQKETPLLASTAQAERAKGSRVEFVQKSGIGYPVGVDSTLHVTSALYGLNGEPNTFFIDASGRVLGHVIGAVAPSELHGWLHRLAGASG